MYRFLWIIPALPLAGFVLLALSGRRMPRAMTAAIGTGSVGLSGILAILTGIQFIRVPPAGGAYTQFLWQWIGIDGFAPTVALYLDALSLLMSVVITFVAFWIHLYSTEFMAGDEAYSRFFAYMNLFVASMLILVLADNLLLLYLGWEGVGLCSYLLIGFWYQDPANGKAAQKAFIVTRIGDTAMAIGLFLLVINLGSLNIQSILSRAQNGWPVGSAIAITVAALLLGGAVGKSAQLPLQTWLPDAMAGPTPVSALIHAATMVTAGVYLIARTHVLYSLAPQVQAVVAVLGVATLIIAGTAALIQHDIKRVLAYSTISQIGYMFLALGVGAWSAAMFHFMTHAFFKALLFLGAGAVIHCLHHEHNIYKMGGLRERLPVVFWTFLIGSASLSGLPIITAGFYSKDLILWHAWSSDRGNAWLWSAGIFAAFVTAIYIFRVVFIVFYGREHTHTDKSPGMRMSIPLVILAFFSITAGFLEMPEGMGNTHWFSSFMSGSLPAEIGQPAARGSEMLLGAIAGLVAISGICVAWFFYGKPSVQKEPQNRNYIEAFLFSGWGFDWLYEKSLIRPFIGLARVNRRDFIDGFYSGVVWICKFLYRIFSATENGRVRLYAGGIALGSVILIAAVVFL